MRRFALYQSVVVEGPPPEAVAEVNRRLPDRLPEDACAFQDVSQTHGQVGPGASQVSIPEHPDERRMPHLCPGPTSRSHCQAAPWIQSETSNPDLQLL